MTHDYFLSLMRLILLLFALGPLLSAFSAEPRLLVQTTLHELGGFDHGKMPEPAFPLLLKFAEDWMKQ